MILAMLASCVGPVHCDTGPDANCVTEDTARNPQPQDADADTDADTDTDTGEEPLSPDWVLPYPTVPWSGTEIVPYLAPDGVEIPANVQIILAEDAYFDGYAARYTCTWYGTIEDAVEVAADDADRWVAWTFRLAFLKTDCGELSGSPFGGEDPTDLLEALTLEIQLGPSSDSFRDSLEREVLDAGLDWENEWAPYVYSGWIGNGNGMQPSEMLYAFAYAMAEDGALQYEEGELVALETLGAEALPAPSWVSANAFYRVSTREFFGL